MEGLLSHVMLSRAQFAFTAMFHILWPVLTIGLSLFLVVTEALWLSTKNKSYYHHTRFWSKIFILNFAIGVVSGIPMEFQFGTNWSFFAEAGGDVFGHLLGFEAAMAFMLEAAFLGIMIWGWERVSPRMHLFSTAMVALGSSLSAFWIMDANSWMQTPVGGRFEGGAFVVESSLAAIFNPDMPWGVSHMWVACVEISIFVVGGISAWYLCRRRNVEFFLRSFKMVLIAAVAITPLQIWLGDGSGREVAKNQPAKLAGIEAHWHTNPPGTPASWNILAWPDKAKQDNRWALKIPYALSLLETRSPTGQVKGLREFPEQDQPPIWAPFYAFRTMVGIGFLLFFLMLWTLWAWRKGKLTVACVSSQKLLLYGWMAAIPLSYVAMESGWLTREVGRQPWIIYGVLRTGDAASLLPAGTVGTSLLTFAAIYATMMGIFLYIVRRILSKGPEVEDIRDEPEPRF